MSFNDAVLWLEQRSVLLVMSVFILIAVTTYWPSRKSKVEDHGMIPFREPPPQDRS